MADYFINVRAQRPTEALIESFFSPTPAPTRQFFRESDLDDVYYLVEPNPDEDSAARLPWLPVDPDGEDFAVAVGEVDAAPTAGTYTLTDPTGAQTTSAIAFDATAATVQTRLRTDLSTNFSAATVDGDAGGPYTISRVTTGAFANLTASNAGLQPSGSIALISNTQNGTSLIPETWMLELLRAVPIGKATGWSAAPTVTAAASVDTAGSATVNKVFRLVWNKLAYGGSVQLSFTGDTATATVGPIAFDAEEEDVLEAFEAHTDVEDGGVDVRKLGPGDYLITCVGTGIKLSNTPALSVVSESLQTPLGYSGTLATNTEGVLALLDGATSANAVFEIRWAGKVVARQESVEVTANLIRAENLSVADVYGRDERIGEVRVFADDTELEAATPTAVGQLAYREDNGSYYTATATDPGAWDPSIYFLSSIRASILFGEGIRLGYTAAKTATYSVSANDFLIPCDASGGAFDVDIPAASSVPGIVLVIKKVDSSGNAITIDADGSDLIDGAGTKTLTSQYQTLILMSVSSAWLILADF